MCYGQNCAWDFLARGGNSTNQGPSSRILYASCNKSQPETNTFEVAAKAEVDFSFVFSKPRHSQPHWQARDADEGALQIGALGGLRLF